MPEKKEEKPVTLYRTPEIPEFRVKYKDVFHLKNLYVMMHEYIMEELWYGSTGEKDHSDIETLYLEKFCQKGLHAGGKELWIYWRLFKFPEGRYSGYVKYHLEIDLHGVYFRDQEIMHQGKKMKVQFGEVEIFFKPRIEIDWQKNWRQHWFLKHIHRLYYSRILSQEMEKREKELWREAYRLQGKVKRYLNLRTFIPTPEPFWHPLYGYES